MRISLLLSFFFLTHMHAAMAQSEPLVQLAGLRVGMPANFESAAREKVPESEIIQGKYLRLVRFSDVLPSRVYHEMEAAGLAVAGYYSPAVYLLVLPSEFDAASLGKWGAVGMLRMKAEWKMAPELREPPYGAWAVRGNQVKVNLQVVPQWSVEAATQYCRTRGMLVEKQAGANLVLQVWLHRDSLFQTADLPFVRYMELAPPASKTEDTKSRGMNRSNLLDSELPSGKKYNGAGVRVLVRDDGAVGPHIDFSGRLNNDHTFIPNLYGAIGSVGVLGRHGDAVAGIIGGAGNLDPTKKGMAAGAEIFAVDYAPDFQDITLPLILEKGITISNTSYSDGCNLGYTLAAQTVDRQLFEHPELTHVFSAGNDNTQDCGYGAGPQWGNITGGHKTAKNCIVVGNIFQDGSIESSSSRGPSRDGRLKPDICANGANQVSTDHDNLYVQFGGTSGAAPGVAGCLAQLTQAYREWHNGDFPPAVLLRSALLNTAYDLGNKGPDFIFGWGQINTFRALQLLEQQRYKPALIDHGAEQAHFVQAPSGLKELRLMLIWNDPPAQPNAARALVNDLDIRVIAPGGATVHLPWKPNPTPNPAILSSPAVTGRDSLNNVEQVVIENPPAGSYMVVVKGTEVPQGPQDYYLSWEFIDDSIQINYPTGGEGLVPGETERIYWDAPGTAGNFRLEYAVDGGAGYQLIGDFPGNTRSYLWQVPNVISSQVRLRISRDGIENSTGAFHIAPLPGNIQVEKVCTDSITISWNEVQDSLEYDVYLLGNKYMELKGHSDLNRCVIPISNAGMAQWISVACTHPSGLKGRRANAVQWLGGLKNCPQSTDLQLSALQQPNAPLLGKCAEGKQYVDILLHNGGLNPISGATLHFDTGLQPIETASVPDLMPDSNLLFHFQTPIAVFADSLYLTVWSELASDHAGFNDTLRAVLTISGPIQSAALHEGFEASPTLPEAWRVINPDGWFGWTNSDGLADITGADGLPTRAMYVNTFDYYEYQNQQDYLYMPPVDLSPLQHPSLVFDLAHRSYDEFTQDGLRVELFPECNTDEAPVVLFEKFGLDLATQPPTNSAYIPTDANEWKRQVIDLIDFAGQTVLIRFSSINGYGNNLFVDNIGIEAFSGNNPAVADILGLSDTICRADTIHVSAYLPNTNTNYAWEFGPSGFPSFAVGPGPHAVYYPTPGNKTITLYAENPWGRDTSVRQVLARPFPTANFTPSGNGLAINFTNSSTNADSYFWDFGDGATSTEQSPEHDYATAGNYSVRLDAINPCKTSSKTIALVLTSGVAELSGQLLLQVNPNPNNGEFNVQIDAASAQELDLQIYNAAGQVLWSARPQLHAGANLVRVQEGAMPAGLYRLQVRNEGVTAWLKVVVE